MAFEGLHAFDRDDAGKRAQLIQRRRLCRYQQAIEEGVSAADDHGAGSGQALLQHRVLTNESTSPGLAGVDQGFGGAAGFGRGFACIDNGLAGEEELVSVGRSGQ